MSAERKIAEGNASIQEAEKCLKTSFMKWKPDYDGAATEYSKAATCFRTAKALDKSKECLLKAAHCYQGNKSYFSAAKHYEQAALICKELNQFTELIELVEKACLLFREHGTPDTAAISLERGAKMIEIKYPEKAASLYLKAAEVVMIEDRPRQAAEFMGKVSRLMVKQERYDEAADMLKKEMEYHIMGENTRAAGRLVVAQVLVHLTRDDYVAASKCWKDGSSFVENEEAGTLITLLDAYDQCDYELVVSALNHPFIKHMDVEYAKLGRSLQQIFAARAEKETSGKNVASTSGISKSHNRSEGASSSKQDQDGESDSEYAGGLL